jgi:hypothetical protein
MVGVDDDESGRQVYVFYFSKDVKFKKPEKLNKWFSHENKQYDFYYTMGPGALIGFPKDETLRLDICGQTAREYAGFIKQAANQWATALKGHLDVKVREPETFYPFSDLNQHCVVLIDDLLSEPNPQSGNYGLTFNTIDLGRAEKIDADVLIFTEEFLKGYKDAIPGIVFDQIARTAYVHQNEPNPFAYTLVHELGHFFGLDHQFDGVPSMMSYEFSNSSLTDYDKEAVRLLYENQNRVASTKSESDAEGEVDSSRASGLSETNIPSGLHGRPE